MVKKYCTLFFCAILILLFFLGCNQKHTDSQVNETLLNNQNNYDIYSLTDPNNSEFNRWINDNEIDKAYNEEITSAMTTREFEEIEKKYVELWENEINANLEELYDILPQESTAVLSESQASWEDYMMCSFSEDNVILNQYFGSSFKWKQISYVRKQYRERAIHLKYFVYCLTELQSPPTNPQN